MTRRELLVVTQYFHPEKVGTAFYTRDAAEWFAARGWGVRVLTGEPHYPDYRRFPGHVPIRRREKMGSIRVRRMRSYVPRSPSPLSRLVAQLIFVVNAAALRLRSRPAPYVLAFSPGMFSVLGARLWRARKGTLVTIVHDVESGLAASTQQLPAWVARLAGRLEAWIYNRSDVVACLSPQMQETLATIGVSRERLIIVPVWLREELFDLDQPVRPAPTTPVVMYSGALGRKQGLHVLVELADDLRSVDDLRVLIRGAGPTRTEMERAAEARTNLDVEDLVPEEQLQAGLEEATLHLVPQEPGGSSFSVPSKLLNILAAGRPVVARAAPGSPMADLASACDALRVAESTEGLKSLTEELLRSPGMTESLGRQGRHFVLEHYTKAHCLGAIEHAFVERAR